MSHHRRTFLIGAGGAAAQAVAASVARADAASVVTIGVIGTGGMGGNHVRHLAARKDVRLAYLCDVDRNRLDAAAKSAASLAAALL